MQQERREGHRKELLKRRILEEANKNRENKGRELKDLDNNGEEYRSRNIRTGTHFESLPKIEAERDREEDINEKKNYQQRYLVFLQSLHHANRSKKEIEEAGAKKKEDKFRKLRDDQGYANVDSKLKMARTRKDKSESVDEHLLLEMARTHSAEKFDSLI